MTTRTRKHLTRTDLLRCYNDDRYLGWGYLADRYSDQSQGKRAKADAIVFRFAAELGWDYEDLFQWANSRHGRHFADWAFGGGVYNAEPTWLPTLFPAAGVLAAEAAR